MTLQNLLKAYRILRGTNHDLAVSAAGDLLRAVEAKPLSEYQKEFDSLRAVEDAERAQKLAAISEAARLLESVFPKVLKGTKWSDDPEVRRVRGLSTKIPHGSLSGVYFPKEIDLQYAKNLLVMQQQNFREQKIRSEETALAWEICVKREIKATTDNVIDLARESIAEDLIREAEERGEVDIDCCSECSSWDARSYRCSCGNRRMGWAITGNLVSGIHIYPEAN